MGNHDHTTNQIAEHSSFAEFADPITGQSQPELSAAGQNIDADGCAVAVTTRERGSGAADRQEPSPAR